MKRSQINAVIRDFEAMLAEHRFALPPFLSFTPEEWQTKGHEYDEVRDNALGWDITDYGEGHFDTKGLYLITLRNGNVHDKKYTKTFWPHISPARQQKRKSLRFFPFWTPTKNLPAHSVKWKKHMWQPAFQHLKRPGTKTSAVFRAA